MKLSLLDQALEFEEQKDSFSIAEQEVIRKELRKELETELDRLNRSLGLT